MKVVTSNFARSLLLAALGLFSVFVAAPASASSLAYVSEPGDPVGLGETVYTESNVSANNYGDLSSIIIFGGDSGQYSLSLLSPTGGPLVPGVYNSPWPDGTGLVFVSENRYCNNSIAGNFKVLEADYGPYGYIHKFHATFEQHCDGLEPGLFGEVNIENPPPPPVLTATLKLDTPLKLKRPSNVVVLTGTLTCSAETSSIINAVLNQKVPGRGTASITMFRAMPCGPVPSQFVFEVPSDTSTPFGQGTAHLDFYTNSYDANYDRYANSSFNGDVTISSAKQ